MTEHHSGTVDEPGDPLEPTRPIRPTGSGRKGAAALPADLVWWEYPGCATPESISIHATGSMPTAGHPTDGPREDP